MYGNFNDVYHYEIFYHLVSGVYWFINLLIEFCNNFFSNQIFYVFFLILNSLVIFELCVDFYFKVRDLSLEFITAKQNDIAKLNYKMSQEKERLIRFNERERFNEEKRLSRYIVSKGNDYDGSKLATAYFNTHPERYTFHYKGKTYYNNKLADNWFKGLNSNGNKVSSFNSSDDDSSIDIELAKEKSKSNRSNFGEMKNRKRSH